MIPVVADPSSNPYMDAKLRKSDTGKILLFHRTTGPRASAILTEGFRDGLIHYGLQTTLEGVWVSNIALRPDQGVKGEAVLRIDIELGEEELAEYEWKEERLKHREWLIPANVLNTRGHIALDGHESGAKQHA